MSHKHTPYFDMFIKFYKVLFSGLLLVALGLTIYSMLTSNYSDAGTTSRSALVFAGLLWVGCNLHWIEKTLKSLR
ncbi:hypothetical protein D3C76_1258250 [compost metagenome]|uniref:hypothetical protein n=1 Tax=Pseudomonas sp. PDM30 TaxID=2854773 RepID=UPI000F9040FF|nr:hypothetical protein [Pseudomonas sp. PDM30]MBV7492527.1 hypothetical protein [Pseudomonas sp. PDM30]